MDTIWNNIFNKKKSEQKEIIDIISKIPIFDGIKKNDLKKIGRAIHIRRFEEDEFVFKEGEPGVGMYIVKEGAVDIWIKDPFSKQERKIASFEKGESFGDVALFNEEAVRSAAAKTTKKSTLLGFCRPDLLGIISRNPVLGSKILTKLLIVAGERLAHNNNLMNKAQNRIRELENQINTEVSNEKN